MDPKSKPAASGKPASTAAALTKVSTVTFIGMTCALVASIRNIPDVAITGWTMIFYMLVATVLFGLPIALIAGEFASMNPNTTGGPEAWVTNSLGEQWGFVTSWLLWVQMFPGMVMIGSVLAPMLGVGISNEKWGEDNIVILVTILIVYWAITLLNMKFDMAKIGGKWGIWAMLYIPIIIIFILGTAALIKVGINQDSLLGGFKAEYLVPWGNKEAISTLQYFGPIIFIFTGIEMSSVYINRLEKPVKQYTTGVFAALIMMLIFNAYSALVCANVLTAKDIDVNNVAQPVVMFCKILGIPTWIGNFFGFLVFIGTIVQLSAWITGPSKTITQSARRGNYNPKFKFWKTNKLGVSNAVLLTQAVIISIFSLVYLLIPGANSAFLTLVNATTIIYCFVYVFMAIGILKLRKDQPNAPRPFRVGKKGDGLLWFWCIVLIIVMAVACFFSVCYSSLMSAILTVVVSVVFLVLGIVVYKAKKPQWKDEVQKLLDAEDPETIAAAPVAAAPAAAPAQAAAPAASDTSAKPQSK
jgi:amino acid transporter